MRKLFESYGLLPKCGLCHSYSDRASYSLLIFFGFNYFVQLMWLTWLSILGTRYLPPKGVIRLLVLLNDLIFGLEKFRRWNCPDLSFRFFVSLLLLHDYTRYEETMPCVRKLFESYGLLPKCGICHSYSDGASHTLFQSMLLIWFSILYCDYICLWLSFLWHSLV